MKIFPIIYRAEIQSDLLLDQKDILRPFLASLCDESSTEKKSLIASYALRVRNNYRRAIHRRERGCNWSNRALFPSVSLAALDRIPPTPSCRALHNPSSSSSSSSSAAAAWHRVIPYRQRRRCCW